MNGKPSPTAARPLQGAQMLIEIVDGRPVPVLPWQIEWKPRRPGPRTLTIDDAARQLGVSPAKLRLDWELTWDGYLSPEELAALRSQAAGN